MTRSFSQRLLAAFVCVVALGCKKQDQEVATGGYTQGQPGAAGGAAMPAPGAAGMGGAASVPPAPSAAAGAPGVAGAAGAGGSAQMLDASAASAVQPALTELARTGVVAGSKPIGGPLVGNFAPGQTLEAQITLQPNKCYSVVAAALPPVSELEVQIVAVTLLPNMTPVLATDQDVGPTAVLGKKPNCYNWAFPMPSPAKVVLRVVGGQGLAAAQVYER